MMATTAPDPRDSRFVDEAVTIKPATTVPHLRGKIDVSQVTAMVETVFRNDGRFRNLNPSGNQDSYVVNAAVVDLTDLFNNVVHLRVSVQDARSGELLFDHLFVGRKLSQSLSLRSIATELQARLFDVRARILLSKALAENKGRERIQELSASRPTSDLTIIFSYPAEDARLSDESVTVIGVVTTSKGMQRLELAVNGRPVPLSRDVRVQGTDVQNHPFTAQVLLRPGQNLITLTAIDTAGGVAQAVRTVYREGDAAVAAPARVGERWAVVIGIDRYRDPAINSLRYATADAEAVFRFLTTMGGVKPSNARLLLNKDATQRNIRQVLGDFLRQKALKEDEVIIYYAGHGTTEPDQGAEGGLAKYLVPWDADPQSLFSTAIPMEEIDRIFGRLSARKILMIQDTCFSGGAGGRTFLAKGLTTRSTNLTDKFLQDLSQKEGRMILTASDVNQVSLEDPALGHGIFTSFLLEALNGAADLDGDGAITVREVHLYLQRRVHERSNGAQTPQLYNIGDMVLVQKQAGAR